MIVDKNCIQQVLGGIIKRPSILVETEKYSLSIQDFSSTFEKVIFQAIKGLYENGAKSINIIDIENALDSNAGAKKIYESNNGIEYLQDIDSFVDIDNFDYYYNKLKKINLLRDFQRQGINISQFYIEDLTNDKAYEVNSKFESLTIQDIIDGIKKKILGLENSYIKNDATETRNVFEGLEDLLSSIKEGNSGIGMPLQGAIYNTVVSGARRGALYIRSGGSGVSKTRQAVGDACYLAFPFRYNFTECEWEQAGNSEKVLFIATEQDFSEIQKMILAYVSGINEDRFKYGNFTTLEKQVIEKAVTLIEKYKDNFHIVRMPNPTIGLVKNIIRENCLIYDIGYVFYDYIFIGPSLLGEFKGFNLRNDEVLLMFATALKDLAVEQNVCVMTSTQLNAKGDDNQNIRNEGSLAGGRATINKADIGAIMARPTKEELDVLVDVISNFEVTPNIVTDIYKVRSGVYSQTRIWSYVDLGTLRKQDLFITNNRLEPIEFNFTGIERMKNWEDDDWEEIRKLNRELNGL